MKIQTLADKFIMSKSEKDFKILMDRLSPGVLKSISKIETDTEKRDEILNVVFAKAWQNIHQYDPNIANFSTWIYKIAYNECLLSKRHSNRTSSLTRMISDGILNEKVISESGVSENYEIETNYAEHTINDLYNKTIDAIYQMNKNGGEGIIRSALIKWHIENKPYKQIANELSIEFGMSIPENTAKNKIFRGKKILLKMIKETDSTLIKKYKEIERCLKN